MVIFFSRRGFIYSWRLVQLSSVALVGASSWFNKQRKSTVGSLPLLRAACRRLGQSGCGPALLVLDAANTLGHLCSVLVLLEIRDSKAAAGEKLTKTKADASQGGSAQLCVCAMDFIVVKVGGVACAREPSITYYRAKTVKNASVTCAK